MIPAVHTLAGCTVEPMLSLRSQSVRKRYPNVNPNPRFRCPPRTIHELPRQERAAGLHPARIQLGLAGVDFVQKGLLRWPGADRANAFQGMMLTFWGLEWGILSKVLMTMAASAIRSVPGCLRLVFELQHVGAEGREGHADTRAVQWYSNCCTLFLDA